MQNKTPMTISINTEVTMPEQLFYIRRDNIIRGLQSNNPKAVAHNIIMADQLFKQHTTLNTPFRISKLTRTERRTALIDGI